MEGKLTAAQRAAIERVVSPERARFDLNTRLALSRDDGVQPPSLWPLSGRTLADGVVWPETEDEIVGLVRIARTEGIPLVPSGGGTSASGGAIPADGGLIVDLCRLSGLVETDALDEFLVDVRAGSNWIALETALEARGLATRLYPSSAPSATVGGWLAQGGAGIGSFGFGWFDQNVESVRLVDGEARVHTLEGADLDGVAEAQGTTGIITEVRLHVRPAESVHPLLIGFPDGSSLAEALSDIALREVPLWSISFIDPNGGEVVNQARYTDPSRPGLPPDAYVALLASTESNRESALLRLMPIVRRTGGWWQSPVIARREWAARFRPLRLLRGRSSAPADVVVPTESLSAVLVDLQRRFPRGLTMEGTVVRGGETVLRAYLDADAPGAGDGLGLGFALRAASLVARHGGRGLSIGRYYGPLANTVLGRQRVELLREMRAWLDPAGIFNPGKVVFGNAPLGAAIQLAARLRNPIRRGGVNATSTGHTDLRPGTPYQERRGGSGES
jgi:FAD/FMN-containing dehydrogenase